MKTIWWIHPGKLVLFFIVPVYAFIVFVVPVWWPEMIVLKAGLYARGAYAALGLACLLALGAFGLIGALVTIDAKQAGSSIAVNPKLLGTIATLAAVAYVIWFYPIVIHRSFIADRTAMNQTPGITSFTQLGVPFVTCYLSAVAVEHKNWGPVIRFQFFMIVILTLMRVQLWSERLAMIELGVPMAVLLFTHRVPTSRFRRALYRFIGAVGPFLGIPALLLVFTLTEFFRSWNTYSQTTNIPLMEFMTSRLTTYYFTAINNGAGMLATQEERWPTFNFFFTAEWLYRLPLGIGSAMSEIALPRGSVSDSFLLRWADIEFNNMSGIYPIVYDLGVVFGVLYFCWFGFVAGVLYRSMVNGRALGLFFYPPVYVGCLEVMRVAYMNGPRVVLILAGAGLAYFSVRMQRARLVRRTRFAERSRVP